MKPFAAIALLSLFLSLRPIISMIKLSETKRHVTIQLRREHGVVVINSKKVRVPYTMEQTSIPTNTKGALEFMFLKDNQICFTTVLLQLVLCLLIILIYYSNGIATTLNKYRRELLAALFYTIVAFAVSEVFSYWVTKAWIIDLKNGINGNPDLFGVNATFLNRNQASLNLNHHFDLNLFLTPIMALIVFVITKRELDAEIAS